MPTQSPLFRGTRELKFSHADIVAIRSAERALATTVRVPRLQPSLTEIFLGGLGGYLSFIVLPLALGFALLAVVKGAIDRSSFGQIEAQTSAESGQTDVQLAARRSGDGGGYGVGVAAALPPPLFTGNADVPPLSEIENQVKALPLSRPIQSFSEVIEVQPPADVEPEDRLEVKESHVQEQKAVEEPQMTHEPQSGSGRASEDRTAIRNQPRLISREVLSSQVLRPDERGGGRESARPWFADYARGRILLRPMPPRALYRRYPNPYWQYSNRFFMRSRSWRRR